MNPNSKIDTKLTSSDIDAILCALDLVSATKSGNYNQDFLNALNCKSASQKLLLRSTTFSDNELRVIFVGIGFALDLITGANNPLISMDELDLEWQNDLKKNFFAYNRLYPYFQKRINDIESQM